MGSEYKLRIEASIPRTPNEYLIQSELHDFFETIDSLASTSEIVNNKEYIYWEGETSGSYKWINEIVERVKESLLTQLRAMSNGNMTEEHLSQLKVRCYVIDLEIWDNVMGDKEL